MGTSVKGLFKGLRYFSQIFDEKEPEMQIGLPTDVKHVAHIGLDGPSAAGNQNNPSWMNEFTSTPQTQTSSDLVSSIRELDLSSANVSTQGSGEQKRATKSKRQTSSESSSSLDSSSARRNSEKGSRRQRSSCPSSDSAAQEGSSRNSRRRRSSNIGTESSSENPIPKHSHRRKSKGSSDGCESTRSCRSRGNDSLTDIPLPVLEAVEEEKA